MASKLFVGSLSYGIDDNSLRSAFEPYGTVVSAQVIMDRETGRSRGFGFVEMENDDMAKAAIEALDGTNLDGRPIVVNPAKDKGRPRAPR